MKQKMRICAALIAACLLFGLCACGAQKTPARADGGQDQYKILRFIAIGKTKEECYTDMQI